VSDAIPIATVPYAFARKFGVILLEPEGERFKVALREGADPRALLEVRRHVPHPLAVESVTPDAFDKLLSNRYAMNGEAAAAAAGSLGLGDDLALIAGDLPTADDLLDSSDDAPAIRLINGVIADAVRQGVSDIHVEPYETGLIVRMRMDGVLRATCACRRTSRPCSSAASRSWLGSTSLSGGCPRMGVSP
jgi:general secretion pathway protein E